MKKGLLLLILLLLPLNVMAASGSIKASSSSSKVTLNNNVTVTVKVSSSDTLGSWQFNISYDKKKLSLVSGDTSIVGYGDGTYKSKSYTYKFKAIATGSATISVDNAKIVDWDSEQAISTSSGNLTLTIKEPVIINYSSDNNLKSLSVEGFTLSPEFNKSTLEYTATLDSHTTKVKISASANDSKAKVSGTGEKEVSEGSNAFEVVVTAENGTSKTYKLNLVVPEKDPVKYSFGDKEYFVLRKLPEDVPVNFNHSTIEFNGEEVACLQNEHLNLTLIYLRDNDNKDNFYIYDLTNKTVKIYNEVKSNDISIYIVEPTKEIKTLEKTTLEINNQKINAYQVRKGSNHYIVYGKDVSTGEGNYYVYDENTKSLILYNEEDVNYLRESNSIYKILTFALSGVILVLFLILFLNANTKKKMNTLIKKLKEENEVLVEKKKISNRKRKQE